MPSMLEEGHFGFVCGFFSGNVFALSNIAFLNNLFLRYFLLLENLCGLRGYAWVKEAGRHG